MDSKTHRPEFAIRAAHGAADMAVVHMLFLEYAAQLGHNLYFQGFTEELATLPGKYAAPRGCLLLAEGAGDWAGCVAVRPSTGPDTCEMKRLYVRQPYRGSGLGRRLAVAAVDCARAAGFTRMVLDTLGSMTPARTLYESLDFRVTEPYYHNPLPDVVYYALDLTAR